MERNLRGKDIDQWIKCVLCACSSIVVWTTIID